MKYFGIIGHAKTAVFSKEIGFLRKHTTFFKLARQLSKLLTFSESSWKIKVRLGLTFFVILFTIAVTYKQRLLHGSKICSIFKTTDAMRMNESIWGSAYKVLNNYWKRMILSPVQFLKTIQLYLKFKANV